MRFCSRSPHTDLHFAVWDLQDTHLVCENYSFGSERLWIHINDLFTRESSHSLANSLLWTQDPVTPGETWNTAVNLLCHSLCNCFAEKIPNVSVFLEPRQQDLELAWLNAHRIFCFQTTSSPRQCCASCVEPAATRIGRHPAYALVLGDCAASFPCSTLHWPGWWCYRWPPTSHGSVTGQDHT